MTDPMAGISQTTVMLLVTAGQYDQLEHQRVMPDRPRVVHVLQVGPHFLPGYWVVVAAQRREEPPETTHWITFAKLEH